MRLLRIENLETPWGSSPSHTKVRGSTFIPHTKTIVKKRWVGNGELAGAIFVGVKLIGDTYVPAGEESTRVNTTDGTVRTFFGGFCFMVEQYQHH